VHRVQRVPVTETAGRVHTSTASVVVLPEADEVGGRMWLSGWVRGFFCCAPQFWAVHGWLWALAAEVVCGLGKNAWQRHRLCQLQCCVRPVPLDQIRTMSKAAQSSPLRHKLAPFAAPRQ
jgi:hypothetical protein